MNYVLRAIPLHGESRGKVDLPFSAVRKRSRRFHVAIITIIDAALIRPIHASCELLPESVAHLTCRRPLMTEISIRYDDYILFFLEKVRDKSENYIGLYF